MNERELANLIIKEIYANMKDNFDLFMSSDLHEIVQKCFVILNRG